MDWYMMNKLVYDEQKRKFSDLQNNTIVTAFEALMDEV